MLHTKKKEVTSRTRAKKVSIWRPLPTEKMIKTLDILPPWSKYVLYLSSLIVLLTTTSISASDQFRLKIACHCDVSVPSTLNKCCEYICVGARGGLMTLRVAGVRRSRFRLWKRPGRRLVHSLRGGAIPLSSQSLIDTKSVSLALRITCETNRRLHRGASIDRGPFKSRRKAAAVTGGMDSLFMAPQQDATEQTMMSASSLRTIRTVSAEELTNERLKEELTVFHSVEHLEPNGNDKRGNATEQISRLKLLRWGPELHSYLNTLLHAIGLDKKSTSESSNIVHNTANNKQQQPMEDELQIILSLTLLYLDRSTNIPLQVDPITGQSWCPPCPHLLPRTVHRLLLTAMSFAAKSVRGDKSISNKLRIAANSVLNEEQAISQIDMETMDYWMLNALGGRSGMHAHQHDLMWQISPDEISIFLRNWGGLFYPQRLAAHDQTRMEHLERLWSDQRDQFGINHGHGNYWSDHVVSAEYPSTPEQHSQLTQRQYYEPF